MVKVLSSGVFKAQREAVWAITNITSGGSNGQIIQMIENYPIIKPYCELLLAKDPHTVIVVLSGLQALLRVAEAANGLTNFCVMLEEIGTVDKLESLQNHENQEIYEKAYQLIDTYFSENEDNYLAPTAVDGALKFNVRNIGGGETFDF